jgi:serine/threonine protein kinase/Flp pilus assembly protein TadD
MSESEARSEIVLNLAEEFLERYRRGERPPLREYINRHPELAAEIKEVFPAMAMMENIAVADESLADPAKKPVTKNQTTPALQQLGDYRIVREIGRGGMGLVYEAEQVSLGRHVALKVLPDKALLDPKHKRRFEREARAAAKLHHTNIVPVFGVGEHDGLPYYVMQFIQGLGLDAVLEELQHMQPGAAHTPSGLPTAGEIRVVPRDVSAAEVARSLMTGEFQQSASDDLLRAANPRPRLEATMAEPAEGGPEHDKPEAGKEVSGPAPRASSSSAATGPLTDSLTASSSSITLPGAARSGSAALARKPNYWQSVAHIGRQVADALAYAHKQGVLHRDIKPSNLLLDLRGTVWVTDFGLAKVSGPGTEGENLTHTGDILGTLRYMPPEAFEGRSDARSDIYALGLTLYEMLTLRPAYEEKDRHKLIKQVTSGEPEPLDKLNSKIPRDLITIVHKAIDREPSRRYATAEELASDLQRFLDDEPIQARRQTQLERYVRWARHNPGIAILGGVLTAVLLIATLASLIVAGRMTQLANDARRNEERSLQNEQKASQNASRAEESEKKTANALATVAAQKAEVEDSLAGSLEYFNAALQRADSYEARKSIFALLARFDMVLGAFVERHPQDQQAQLTLARRLAERGQKRLAEKQPAQAQAELEKSQAVFTRFVGTSNDWKVLSPVEMKAASGAKMELQNDGSVFVHQNRSAETETYTLAFRTELKGITGLRLEALADSRLPNGGPGWADNGNFIVSELTLDAVPVSHRTLLTANACSMVAQASLSQSIGAGPAPYLMGVAASGMPARPIPLRNPMADFSQSGWDVRGAVDGNIRTGWAVFPENNKDHTAIFELAEPIGDGHESVLTVRLHHEFVAGKDHNLGRFRLSMTNDATVLQARRIRWIDLKDSEIADVHVALGKACSQQGQTDEAIASFIQALPLVADRSAKARIIAEAAPLGGVLEKMAERASGDGRFQAELARHLAERGDAPLSEAAHKKARTWLEAKLAKEPENSALAAELAQVLLDRQEQANANRWTVLEPDEMKSEGGATLATLDDRSILVGGRLPQQDIYTLTFRHVPARVQGLRLEVLTHDSLPQNGPGRAGNGNFTLTTVKAQLDQPSKPGEVRILKLAKAWADFSQRERDVSAAIDANETSGWAVDHGGKPHVAVFELAEPVAVTEGTVLRVTLEFKADLGYQLGRFRLSASANPSTLELEEKRLAAMQLADSWRKLTDPWLRLAAAYAMNGLYEEALQHFSIALKRADSYEARKSILEVAARFDVVVAALYKRQPDDPQLELAVARQLAEQGRRSLAENQFPQAQSELEKARAIFTRLLTATNNWQSLKPIEMKAESDARMELQDDGSIFVHQGEPPIRDTYTLVFQTELKDIAGLRLEALADSRLPKGGPGWSGNGNFHLSELTLQAAAADSPDKARAIALRDAWADFSEVTSETGGTDVRGAIDGNPRTAWAVWPQVNKDHTAVFQLAERVGDGAGTRLTIRLINRYAGIPDHNLGRFRLSVTNERTTLQAMRLRHDLQDSELVDLYTALGTAYGQQGQTKEAIASFTEALRLVADRAGKLKIIAAAAACEEDLLSGLSKGQPDDPQLLLALARHHAERGKRRLAEKQAAQAQGELEKARAILTRLLTQHPVPKWTVLEATSMKSQGGAILTLQKDGSILAGGTNPNADIYTITTKVALQRVTAFRLETLPDPSLPFGASGRAPENGNFALSEWRVVAQPQKPSTTPRLIQWKDVWSDHRLEPAEHYGKRPMHIGLVIDGDPRTYWESWPNSGVPRQAIFVPDTPIVGAEQLEFILDFRSLLRHNLGRFRLSVTGDDDALEAERLRNELKDSEVADLNVALAEAHAQQGHTDEAVASLTEALHLTADRAGKARIIAQAGAMKGVLEKLAEQSAGDVQGELARHFAAQGQTVLADAARTKARTWLEATLAKHPENSALATELADLLLLDMTPWSVLKPFEMKSKSGVTFTVQNDQSILVSEKYATKDVYSVDFPDLPQGFHAIRLEALRDDRLPNGGPGTHSGGNFVLSAFQVFSLDDKQASGLKQILLRSACATFEERPAQQSLDAIPGGGWSIFGGQQQSQAAYFSVERDTKIPGSNRLRILLNFSHIPADGTPATLGRFRLSVSADANAFDRERCRLAILKATDPWIKLGAAYHMIGDQQTVDKLVKQHPAAAAGIGDLFAAVGDWERAIAVYRKLITDQPADGALLTKLAAAYQSVGRTREAISYLVKASAADPKDTILSMKVAALQAWYKQDKELAATRERILAFAKETDDWPTAERAAKVCSLVPLSDKAELEAVLAAGRSGVKLARGEWTLLALGMAEYRGGDDAAADEDLSAAAEAGPNTPYATGMSAFFRAMSLFRQGKKEEARKLAIAAAARMKPLPADEQNPLTDGAHHDDLILWLAYKEAKALLKIDAAPAANWLTLALVHHQRGETDQAKKACGKAAEMMKLAGGLDEALRPLLRQAVLAVGTESPEAKELIATSVGEPPAALNEVIEQHPDQAQGYRDRGNWYAERGRWKDAIADYAEVYRLDPNTQDAMKLGILLAQNGEKDRYREHGQAMLSRWTATDNNSEADQTLKTIVLLPDYKGDAKQLARLAEAAVAGNPAQDYYEWFLVAKALHELRTGRYAGALTACRASRKLAPESKYEPQIVTALDLAIEAMALQGEGKAEEARRTLDLAKPLIESHVSGVDVGGAWADWLSAHILYREAEALLAAKKTEPKK